MRLTKPKISIEISRRVLESVFDECDRYDRDETGGRIVGTYQRRGKALKVNVSGVIEPGPKARRSSTSFFQDGDHQARVFRRIEQDHPDIEHLGNWHTHHVNGYPTLSGGDIETYQRNVNHDLHNLDFFYALLVVARNAGGRDAGRYRVRHYVLFRGDDRVHEVDAGNIKVTDDPPVWPATAAVDTGASARSTEVRARDKTIIEALYPEIRPFRSKKAHTVYWKGPLRLVDESVVQLTIPEMPEDARGGTSVYQVLTKDAPDACAELSEALTEHPFDSAISAIRGVENAMNRSLYEAAAAAKEKG